VATLTELGTLHGTNKVKASSKRRPLTEIYEPYLAGLRERPLRILELGIERGGSLRMWRDYFPRAQVIGVDVVRDRVQYASERIEVVIGDQKDPKVLAPIVAGGPLDLVLDDGSHRAAEQQGSLLHLWPHVKPGGYYVIEDVHTSYREKYEMAWRQPGTTMELVKDLLDDVHALVHKQPVTLEELEFVHLYFTTCVLRKRPPKGEPAPPFSVPS
jgi:23S rRNA U2552 (ribose-2'-O)-methylase RlmE/FtsJ